MAREIERKFKVCDDSWRSLATKTSTIVQGYLTHAITRAVRVRLIDDRATLTIKGITNNSARDEYEYAIPVDDAREMLHSLCLQPPIQKTRSYVPQGDLMWEIDVYQAPQHDLIVAEIELPNIDHPFEKPAWIGEELTGDPRYYNQNITFRRP